MEQHTEIMDYTFVLASYIAEAIAAEDVVQKVQSIRIAALGTLRKQLEAYKRLGYDSVLLCGIAQKKGQFILEADSKAEIEKILSPPKPQFNGNQFQPGSYFVPEEELICWSETSLRAPLNEYGYKRYEELFALVFPEKSKAIFG